MNDTVRELGSVAGLFLVVGLGVGLAGAVPMTRLGGVGSGLLSGVVVAQAFGVLYFVGPAVGALGGVLAGVRSQDTATGALAGGVGSLVGFYLLFSAAFLVMTGTAAALGGASPSLGDGLPLLAAAGVPTALVGAVAGAIAGVGHASAAAASRLDW